MLFRSVSGSLTGVTTNVNGGVLAGAGTVGALNVNNGGTVSPGQPGVDNGSVRVAVETFTLSFAFDPKKTPLIAVQMAIDRRLKPKNLSLMPLRIIDSPAELKVVKR